MASRDLTVSAGGHPFSLNLQITKTSVELMCSTWCTNGIVYRFTKPPLFALRLEQERALILYFQFSNNFLLLAYLIPNQKTYLIPSDFKYTHFCQTYGRIVIFVIIELKFFQSFLACKLAPRPVRDHRAISSSCSLEVPCLLVNYKVYILFMSSCYQLQCSLIKH